MIKVMSFNIRYGLADDGENCWDKRKSLVVSRVRSFDPDLLGLQECRDDTQAEFVKSKLSAYHFYGVRREGNGDTALEMAPILFRKASFQLIQTGQFWLSQTPQSPGSKSWDSVFARTATWVKLLHLPTSRSLVFLNTHFDYQPVAIAESAKLLQRWAIQTIKRHPLVLTGDFNTDKNSLAYKQMKAHGNLADTYRQVHPQRDNETTFHGFGGTSSELAPLDWILVSKHFEVLEAKIDRAQEGKLFPSDHYPVTAVLIWKDQGENMA